MAERTTKLTSATGFYYKDKHPAEIPYSDMGNYE